MKAPKSITQTKELESALPDAVPSSPPTFLDQQRQEQEKKEILRRYRALLRIARPHLSGDDAKKIKKAFEIAHDAHQGVRRKSGEPYIYHPLEVARIVVEEMGLGTTSIICALLHDVVEDTEVKLADIEQVFGKKVSRIIDGLTKVPAPTQMFGINKSAQAETFRKVLMTISEDIRVVLIKIADRLHNMRTLESMSKEKQLKIQAETQYIYAPIAHRLGLYNIRSELDDLCLKYANPEVYQDIISKIAKSKSARTRFINEFNKPIIEALDRLGLKYDIKSRLKAVSSIWNKMQKQKVPFEEVFDLFAIRIIIDTSEGDDEKAACWRVYSIVTDFYQPNVSRLRDWVSVPKANNYESLHTTVMSRKGQWVEVQIRTRRMDEIAEKGYAAHWKYKGGNDKGEQGIEKWIAKVRETIENQDLSALEMVDNFRAELFDKEIYVFTPTGDLKVFPKGATILDFAFDIHSGLGEHCLGGKVNHKLVPLNYQLQNGDQIEILKSSKPKVNEDWLKFVYTARAKQKIKQALKKDHKALSDSGKEIISRKLKQLKIQMTDEVLGQLTDYFGLSTPTDLFIKVGKGEIDHTQIKKFREESEKHKDAPKDVKEVKEILQKEHQKDVLVIGDGKAGVEYVLSQCCKPIAGDSIFGIVTVSRGIRIHRTDCPNATAMLASFGDRVIKVQWAKDKPNKFDVSLHIIGTDRQGLINDLTYIISHAHKVNICSLNIGTQNGNVFDGRVTVSVSNSQQVQNLVEDIKRIEGVVNVHRFDE
ncbi:RelA/SpoT family protein [Hugenholtzia roseola]|uniref:RelA/SpoT family protein n=1 Tax=Hugenholtzia roseola TaxID=1002 RepID=UPI0004283E5A|nr:RelA/SpoT family protein [Hugenholtzia roseola]